MALIAVGPKPSRAEDCRKQPPWFDTTDCAYKQQPYVFVGNTYDAISGNTNCRLVINVCGTYIVRTKTIKAGSGESCFDANKISRPWICCDQWSRHSGPGATGKCIPTVDADCDGINNDSDGDPFKPDNGGVGFIYVNSPAGKVTIYEAPSTDSRPIVQAPNGARIVYTAVVEQNGQLWYQARPPGAPPGWVQGSGVSCSHPAPIPAGDPRHLIDSGLGTRHSTPSMCVCAHG
jgi:hypothetical protein